MSALVIKNDKKKSEDFSREKLIESIYKTCLALRMPKGISKDTANTVVLATEEWLEDKSEVTSTDIRRVTSAFLAELNPEAAHFYKNYRKTL